MKTATRTSEPALSLAELSKILNEATEAHLRVKRRGGRLGNKTEAATHRAKYLAIFTRHADPNVEISKWVESCLKELRAKSLELKIEPDSQDAQKDLFTKINQYRRLLQIYLDETPNKK